MSPVRRALLAALVLLPASAAPAAASTCTTSSAWPAASAPPADQVVALVNAHRRGLGEGDLVVTPSLTASAQWEARNMAAYGSSRERAAALDGWLWTYNHRRQHGALSHKPPIARLSELNNLAGSYS